MSVRSLRVLHIRMGRRCYAWDYSGPQTWNLAMLVLVVRRAPWRASLIGISYALSECVVLGLCIARIRRSDWAYALYECAQVLLAVGVCLFPVWPRVMKVRAARGGDECARELFLFVCVCVCVCVCGGGGAGAPVV